MISLKYRALITQMIPIQKTKETVLLNKTVSLSIKLLIIFSPYRNYSEDQNSKRFA